VIAAFSFWSGAVVSLPL